MSDFVNRLDEGITNVVETLQTAQENLRNGENINPQLRTARVKLNELESEARLETNHS